MGGIINIICGVLSSIFGFIIGLYIVAFFEYHLGATVFITVYFTNVYTFCYGLVGLVASLLGAVAHLFFIILFLCIVYLIPYVIAAIVSSSSNTTAGAISNGVEDVMRSSMIGLNAGINFGICLFLIPFQPFIVAAFINWLGIFKWPGIFKFTTDPTYQGFLGWSGWFLPMSWPANLIGLIWFLINWVASLFTGAAISWRKGAVIQYRAPLMPINTGISIGNFNCIGVNTAPRLRIPPAIPTPANPIVCTLPRFTTNTLAKAGLALHEEGHTLNTASFGSIFLLFNLFDQSVFGRAEEAYGEYCAESHCRRSSMFVMDLRNNPIVCANIRWVPLWGAAANIPPTASVTISPPIAAPAIMPTVSISAVPPANSFTFDASASFNNDNQPLGIPMSYLWAVNTPPGSGSTAEPVDPSAPTTLFTPDAVGIYTVFLIVNDGIENSDSLIMDIEAIA